MFCGKQIEWRLLAINWISGKFLEHSGNTRTFKGFWNTVDYQEIWNKWRRINEYKV